MSAEPRTVPAGSPLRSLARALMNSASLDAVSAAAAPSDRAEP